MPGGDGLYGPARLMTIAALAAACVVAALLLLGPGATGYELRVRAENAGQLVKGNLVKVGGVEVGSVRDIRLTDDNRAELLLAIEDADLVPLHQGTTAAIRMSSLSSVAGRHVALSPGPNNLPPLPDGATIPAERVRSIVDLDQVLNTLDAEVRSALQDVIHGSATVYAGRAREANSGLEALNPALAQAAATTRELLADEGSLERFVVQAASVVSAVAERDGDLERGIASAAAVSTEAASENAALADALRLGPATLRRADTTLVNLRAALRDVRPALREAQPVAPRLARALAVLAPLTRRARPAVAGVRALVPDAAAALRGLPALDRSARPAVVDATGALDGAQAIVAALRPYTPDLVAGLLNGFGGVTAGYYDANGHYARISVQGNSYSLTNGGAVVPVPPADGSLAGYRRGIDARCPGAAAQRHPDSSNPWIAPEAPCDPADSP